MLTIILAIVAVVAICFGVTQVMGGYAVGSGIASFVIGAIIALQGVFGVAEVIHIA